MIDPDTLWELEASSALGRLSCLIELAQDVYERRGGDDFDYWDYNGPLLLAIQTAQAELTSRRLDQDLSCVGAHVDDTLATLANAIAIRMGEDPRRIWDTELLVDLARRWLKP
jgi:hypothetical protein